MKNELGKSAAAQIVLMAERHAVLFGVWRGEAATVLSKAIKLCLGVWELGKKFSGCFTDHVPFPGAGFRRAATLLTNLHLPNFLKGGLYRGAGTVCVPTGPLFPVRAASGACPIGAFQAVVGSSKFSSPTISQAFSFLLGVLLGRFICGFLCPFNGWFQELLLKIPTKKLSQRS